MRTFFTISEYGLNGLKNNNSLNLKVEVWAKIMINLAKTHLGGD
jgi:hypothetical protein